MTSCIFDEWLNILNKKFNHENRKILLFIDNFSGHNNNEWNFSNINLIFLPQNTTSILQPLDQGIIKNFKVIYRSKVINRLLAQMDFNEEIEIKIDIKNAIDYTVSSWNEIKQSCVKNCFEKCGFKFDNQSFETNHDPLIIEPSFENLWQQLCRKRSNLLKIDFNDYVSIDNNVQTTSAITDADIVNQIMNSNDMENQNKSDDSESSDKEDNADVEVEIPKRNECLKYKGLIRLYFQAQSRNNEEILLQIQNIENNILHAEMVQPKINDFFKKM